jgi:hypothetical protein
MTDGRFDDERHTDGNDVAGMLQQIFVTDFTMFERRCQSCGDRSAAGAHRMYRSAGVVLRCPRCSDLALRLADQGDRVVFELFGTWSSNGAG